MPVKKKATPKKAAPTFWAHLFYASCMNYDKSFWSTISQAEAIKQAQTYVADGDSDEGEGDYVIFTGLGIHFSAYEPDSNDFEIQEFPPNPLVFST